MSTSRIKVSNKGKRIRKSKENKRMKEGNILMMDCARKVGLVNI